MDAEYLNGTVSSTLTEALALLTRLKPEDPIEWLGKYLVSAADNLDRHARPASHPKSPASHDASVPVAKQSTAEEEVAALEAELAACNEVSSAVLDRVVALVKRTTGAVGVYIGEKVGSGSGFLADGEEPPPLTPGSTCVKYIAATSESTFMLKERLREGQGVTWKCWVMPDAAPPTDDDSTPAPPELPVIHEADVLHNPRVHFFVVPKAGAICVAPIQYDSLLHDDAIPDGAVLIPPPPPEVEGEEEEGGEGEEEAKGGDEEDGGGKEGGDEGGEEAKPRRKKRGGPPPPPPVNAIQRSLAICADTLGQRRPFTDAQIAAVRRVANAVKLALQRTELKLYAEEFEAARALALMDEASVAAVRDATTSRLAAATSDAEAEVAAEQAKLEDSAIVPDDKRALAIATHSLAAAKSLLVDDRSGNLAELSSRRIGVKSEALRFVQGLLYFFGIKKEKQGDPSAPDVTKFEWSVARTLLAPAALLPLLEAFKPEALHSTSPGAKPVSRSLAYLTSAAVREHVAGITTDELDRVNPALGALHMWLTAAMDAQDAWAAQRVRVAEEEAAAVLAKAVAEEEARAAAASAAEAEAEAAAQAAAASAEAAGGEAPEAEQQEE